MATKRKFVPTSQAMKTLGRSRDWFTARKKSGTFVSGIHYKNTSDGVRPTWEWCIEEIEALYGKS